MVLGAPKLMAQGRMELEGEPGRYVSRGRARWLMGEGLARATVHGTLALRPGAGIDAAELSEHRLWWSPYSGRGGRQAFHMMGDAVNHGAQ